MHSDLNSHAERLAQLLRALPQEGAAPYGYREFERRAQARGRPGRGLAGGERLAAVALLGVALLALLVRLGVPHTTGGHGTAGAAAVQVRAAPGPEDESLPPHAAVAERWLASLPSEPAVVHVGTRAAVMGLEDRIAQVDDLLSAARTNRDQPARLAALQQERARLVGTLVQVRYAETLADGAL